MKNTKTLAVQVTNQFSDKLLKTLECAKQSPANMSIPLTKSEMLRQCALIGMDIVQCLGENYQGNVHAANLAIKKIGCNKTTDTATS